MIFSPQEQYQQDLLAPDFLPDATQAAAMANLEVIYHQLCAEITSRQRWHKLFRKAKTIQGLYMYGGVGTGKSYLMNTFFHCLPFPQKMRLHFHEFMQQVHADLTALQGEKNPIALIAKQWAKKTCVLCFDEFFVKDIADAMVLGNLLTALFAQGVCLIATSNVQPQNLYHNGLQRERFMPAIKVILQSVNVITVDSDIDYRQQYHEPAGVYFTPLDVTAEQAMMQTFHFYTGEDVGHHDALQINKREFETIRASEKVAWFHFSQLCQMPRGPEDYLAIAERFPVILLSAVPQFKGRKVDAAVRFINLIDVLYDQHILLIVSAASQIAQLYTTGKWAFEFERTQSRLTEMGGEEYRQACVNKWGLNNVES
jgi:cell division protein ZapE